MVINEKRKYKRIPFVKAIIYSASALKMDELDEFFNDGVAVNVSEGGLGMITDYPLKVGDIVTFKHEIKVKKIVASSSIVRWAREIETDRYRVGLEFFRRLRMI